MQRFIINSNRVKENAINAILELDIKKQLAVEIKKPTRSNAQNNLYWMWVEEYQKKFGLSKEQAHTELAVQYMTEDTMTLCYKNGVGFMVPYSTSRLNVKQFSEYLLSVEAGLWHEHQMTLPHPEDYKYALGFAKDLKRKDQPHNSPICDSLPESVVEPQSGYSIANSGASGGEV